MREFQVKNIRLDIKIEIDDFPLMEDLECKDKEIIILQSQSFYEKTLEEKRSPKIRTRRKNKR